MISYLVFALFTFSSVSCYPSEDAQLYEYRSDLPMVYRERRSPQNRVGLDLNNQFGRVDASGKIWEGANGHRVDAGGHYQRNFHSLPKNDYGGSVSYGKPDSFSITGSGGAMDHQKHLRADAGVNLFNNGRSTLGAGGYYQRNFGGPGPRQDYGGMINFKHKF